MHFLAFMTGTDSYGQKFEPETPQIRPYYNYCMQLHMCLYHTAGGTRCFCNEASCVRTGYMCKSLLDACFSLLSPDGHRFRSTHGCADSLPEASRDACANGSHGTVYEKEVQLSDEGQTQRQRLLCCRLDMCNYMDGTNVVLLSAISNNNNGSASN